MTALREWLRAKGIRPRRRLGQNFLTDANFLAAIVRAAEVGPEDAVVEIGTGPGNLTEQVRCRTTLLEAAVRDVNKPLLTALHRGTTTELTASR